MCGKKAEPLIINQEEGQVFGKGERKTLIWKLLGCRVRKAVEELTKKWIWVVFQEAIFFRMSSAGKNTTGTFVSEDKAIVLMVGFN